MTGRLQIAKHYAAKLAGIAFDAALIAAEGALEFIAPSPQPVRVVETPWSNPDHDVAADLRQAFEQCFNPAPEFYDPKFGERGMQMICATVCSGRPDSEQLRDINRIVDAWTFRPETLTNSAMIEDLPLSNK